MDETFSHLDHLRRTEQRVALATLVGTRGTTPKKEGAKMWVGAGGRILGSVTIGGCVDARVIAEAERVLAGTAPQLVSLDLGDEDAWELGLTCGGTVQVLIEPVELAHADHPLLAAYDRVRAETAAGRRVATVTPLDGNPGRLVVRDGVAIAGSLGDAALDAAAVAAATGAVGRGASHVVTLGPTPGAGVPAFVEVHAPPATLVVFGAGHLAVPLVAFATELGWRTMVVDGRERFATRERFPQATEIRVGMMSEIAAGLAYGPRTAVVLVAHDYKFEVPVLREVLARDAGYVGLLGSRKRGRAVLDFLAAEGVAEERLAQVRTPVGLDIGARSAAEIALSIVAEVCAVVAGRPGTPMRDRANQREDTRAVAGR